MKVNEKSPGMAHFLKKAYLEILKKCQSLIVLRDKSSYIKQIVFIRALDGL